MRLITFLALFQVMSAVSSGQSGVPMKQKIMHASVLDTAFQKTKGFIYSISDTSIMLSERAIGLTGKPTLQNTATFNLTEINEITIRPRRAAGKGALIGAAAGILIGVIAGFVEGDDEESWIMFTAEEKALMYGLFGGGVGTGAGAITGALVKKRFIIGGKKQQFDKMKGSVLEKIYGNPSQK